MRIRNLVVFNKSLILLFAYLLSYLAFLRLSAWGGGFTGVSSIDSIALAKLSVRFMTFTVALIYLLKYTKVINQYIRTPYLEMFFFLLLALLSIGYTSDIFNSSFRAAEHIGYFIFSLVVVINLSRNHQDSSDVIKRGINLILYGLGTLVFVVWFTMSVAPEYVFSHIVNDIKGLGGDIIHVHTLSNIACLIYGVIFHRLLNKDKKHNYIYMFVCLIMLITIYMTHSRSGLVIALLLTVMVLIYHRRRKPMLIVFPIIGLFLLLFLANNFDVLLQYVLRGQEKKDLFQLTERMVFWKVLLVDTASERLLLGYGYQMMSDDGMFKYFPLQRYTISNAHNTFIQTFVGLGILGVSLLLFHIIKTFISLRYVYRNMGKHGKHLAFELFIIIVTCLLASLTQFGIVGLTTPVVPAYFMAIMLLTYQRIQIVNSMKNIKISQGLS